MARYTQYFLKQEEPAKRLPLTDVIYYTMVGMGCVNLALGIGAILCYYF